MPAVPAAITAWTVSVGEEKPSIFNDIDVALDYLRGYVGTNGDRPGTRAVLESRRMSEQRYAAEVEAEESAIGVTR